jgi:cytochrome c556
MKRAILLTAMVGALAGAGVRAQEANTPYDAVVKEMIAATDKITSILATIKDSTSAEAARPELKKAVAQFLKIRQRAERLPQPDGKERERISRTYAKKLEAAVERNRQERARVAGVAGGREALHELDALEPPAKKK